MTKRDKMLERARNMLARAEHPNTPEAERELCYSRYNKLVQDYAIEEAELEAALTAEQRQTPEAKQFRMPPSTLAAKWRTVVGEICRTYRCRATFKEYSEYVTEESRTVRSDEYTIVGFPSDIAFVEMLVTSTFFTFVTQLNPRWDSSLTFEHNVYRYKQAGRKWEEIANAANSLGVFVPWPDGGRLIRAYKTHCKLVGEEPTNHTQRHGAYRESFADGFVQRLGARLEQMRQDNLQGSGKELVLLRGPQVDDAFYDLFPWARPMSAEERELLEQQEREARERAAREREEMLAKMSESQKAALFRKEERERLRSAKEDDKYWRRMEREEAKTKDSAGKRAGRAAADKVNIERHSGDLQGDTTRKALQ